jgi:hypothetical protein
MYKRGCLFYEVTPQKILMALIKIVLNFRFQIPSKYFGRERMPTLFLLAKNGSVLFSACILPQNTQYPKHHVFSYLLFRNSNSKTLTNGILLSKFFL